MSWTPIIKRCQTRTTDTTSIEAHGADRWKTRVLVGEVDNIDDLLIPNHQMDLSRSRMREKIAPLDPLRYLVFFVVDYRGLLVTLVSTHNSTQRCSHRTAAAQVRTVYIKLLMTDKHGRTLGCPKCENYSPGHSEERRRHSDEEMISSSEALVLDHAIDLLMSHPAWETLVAEPETRRTLERDNELDPSKEPTLSVCPNHEVNELLDEPETKLCRDTRNDFLEIRRNQDAHESSKTSSRVTLSNQRWI